MGRDKLQDLEVGESVVDHKEAASEVWARFMWLRIGSSSECCTELSGSIKGGGFLTNLATIRLSRTLFNVIGIHFHAMDGTVQSSIQYYSSTV
jgi:hypothetical protein